MRNAGAHIFTIFVVLFVVAENESLGAEHIPTIKTFSSYSRLTFPASLKSEFKVKQDESDNNQIRIQIENMGPQKWPTEMRLSDERVSTVEIISDSGDKKDLGIRLKNPHLHYFTYFQPAPPAIVLDVWPKDVEVETKNATNKVDPKRNVAESLPKRVKHLAEPHLAKPSNKAMISKTGPLHFNKNFFYEFPMETPKFVYRGKNFDTVKELDPGSGWEWTKPDIQKPGGVNFSLAQKLFRSKQYALCIKTVEFARRDFPSGEYMDEMAFLEALAYRKFGIAEKSSFLLSKAEDKLKELMLKQKQGKGELPFSNKIRIYFASEAFRSERWLDAISHFEFISNEPAAAKEEDYDGILMATAESYFALRHYRRAERIYRSIIDRSQNQRIMREAAYRLGNILAHEKSFEKADEALRKALKDFPEYESERAEAYFNLAEVNFWKGDLKKSKEYLEKFLDKHPSNTLGAEAYIRLGEIYELLHADLAKARENYAAAINRFPFSAGDTLGRIRLARLDLEKEKDLDFQLQYLQQILNSKKYPNEIAAMAQETLVPYLNKSKKFPEAVASAEIGLSSYSGKGYEIFKILYIESLRNLMTSLVEKKDYSNALDLYKAKAKWLEQIGPEINKLLAEIYEGLELPTTSNFFMTKYLSEIEKIDKDRRPSSYGDDRDGAILVGARAEYLQGRFSGAIETLGNINSMEALRIKALSNMKLNKLDESKKIADEALKKYLKMRNKLPPEEFDRGVIDLSEILFSWADSRKDYKEMESILSKASDELHKGYERFSFLYADVLWYQQKHRKAMDAYKKAIATYPQSIRLGRSNYRLAISYLATGNKSEAVKILSQLRDGSQNIWSESARQELELISWEKKYSVILGDLPPMGLGLED